MELAEETAGLVDIEPLDALVEPDLAGAEGAYALVLEVDGADWVAGEDVADGVATFDGERLEVEVEADFFDFRVADVMDGDDFGFAVGVGREVEDFAALGAFGEEVFAVAGDGGDAEAFDHGVASGAVAVDHVIDGAFVAFPEDGDVEEFLAVLGAYETFFLHFGDNHGAVAAECDDVVHFGAFASHFDSVLAFEAPTGETGLVVDVEFFVGDGDLGGFDVVEVTDFGFAFTPLAVFFEVCRTWRFF